jgi:uncharacterized protein (TIGR03086 family)
MTINRPRDEAAIEADDRVPLIRITRDFAASPGQLLRAHTEPELFARWVGPDGMSTRIVEWDARDGGCWHYVSSRDGVDYEFRGCFHQITDERIVQTFAFVGMADDVALENIRFEDLGDGHTRLRAQSLVDSFEGRDAWLSSGMETGVNEGYRKLDALLAAGNVEVELSRLGAAARHRAVARRFGEVVAATPDWHAPTPVNGWVARDVVGHLVEWFPAFLASGGVELPAGPGVESDPIGAWMALSAGVQALLDDEALARSQFTHPYVGTHQLDDAIDRFYTADVFMHTWDLARASCVDPHLDPSYCTRLVEGMEPIDEVLRSSGQFGPRFPVADDADPMTRLIGFIGRDPHWDLLTGSRG